MIDEGNHVPNFVRRYTIYIAVAEPPAATSRGEIPKMDLARFIGQNDSGQYMIALIDVGDDGV